MHFGSDEMKELLICACDDPAMYEKAMIEVYESVKAYTLYRIKTGFIRGEIEQGSKGITTHTIEADEYEDIISEVFCRVVKSLDGFIKNANRYEPSQRQSWLRSIVYRTIADYLTERRRLVVSDELTEEEGNEKSRERDEFDAIHFASVLKNVVRVVCLAPSKPEKILAYIYNVLIFRELAGRRKNGAATAASNYMNGKKLHTLKNAMVEFIDAVFGVEITPEEIKPLILALGDEYPEGRGCDICEVTPKRVADWSNRIKTYLYSLRKEFFGEESESNAI